jgi:hypothetical protein
LTGKGQTFEWFSFAAGLVCGVVIFAFVELVVTLRWLLVSLILSYNRLQLQAIPLAQRRDGLSTNCCDSCINRLLICKIKFRHPVLLVF